MFKVQKKMCPTCIYRPDCPLDLAKLENQVRDEHMGFKAHRICHHAPDNSGICCRGFWEAHKDEFPAGQLAQRLNVVEFVDIDIRKRKEKPCKPAKRNNRRGKNGKSIQC